MTAQFWLWLVLSGLVGGIVGWWARGRKASGREIKIKREWTDRLHTVEEHSKRCLARARDEAETKLRVLGDERDRLAARLGLDPAAQAPGGARPSEAPSPSLPELGPSFSEPGQLLPAARLRPLRPRSSRPSGDGLSSAADDLKRIKGIGPAYERALCELGYTTYASIARLDEREITELSARFGGRARPSQWVAAAAALSRESTTLDA